MARYDSALYDVDTYDQQTHSVDTSGVVLTATAIDDRTVRVDWRNPQISHVSRRIVRSTFGFPPDPVSGQSVTLISVDAVDPTDPNFYTTSLTDVVSPGSEVYYAMFVQVPDYETPLATRWEVVATATTRLYLKHNADERLRAAIPAAFTSTAGGEIGGNADADEPLTAVTKGLGDSYDKILTDADRLLSVWEPSKIPSPLVRAASQSLGLPYEPALGPKPQRAFIANGVRIFNLKSTYESLRLLTACATGVSVVTQRGKNLLPSTLVSGYEDETALKTVLSANVTTTDDTIQVATDRGWPLDRFHDGTLKRPLWIVVRTGTTTEVMKIVKVNGTTWTVERGDPPMSHWGTSRQNHSVGGSVSSYVTWHNWVIQPGYDLDVVDSSETGFTMPAASSTVPDQPPHQEHCLKITRVSDAPVGAPVLMYAQVRYVTNYRRVGNVGYVTTYQPHGLTRGQTVKSYLGSALTNGVTLLITNILDRFTFTVDHTGQNLPDVVMPTSDIMTYNPLVIPHPGAETLVAVQAGQPYVYSAFIRGGTTGREARAIINWIDGYGNTIGSAFGNMHTDDSTLWKRLVAEGTAPVGAVMAEARVQYTLSDQWAKNEIHYVTQHQFEQAEIATGYDDGGVVRLGLNAKSDIDPYKVVRTRTRQLLSDYGTEGTYRLEFLERSVQFGTRSTWAAVNIGATSWGDFDIKTRVQFDTLTSDDMSVLVTTQDSGVLQWGLTVNSNVFKFMQNAPGAGAAYGQGDYGSGSFGGIGVISSLSSDPHGLHAGWRGWVRIERNKVTGQVTFYTAPDSQSEPYIWTSIGSPTGPTGDLTHQTTKVLVGSSTGTGFIGNLYRINTLVYASEPLSLDPWLYDQYRNLIPNAGSSGGDWSLSSTDPDSALIVTAFP